MDAQARTTTVLVRVETPKGSFRKRSGQGRVEFLSPLPCPFNYGCVPGTRAEDGEPEDALLLGARRRRGETCLAAVVGVVAFVDAGQRDDKLVCASGRELDRVRTRILIRAFFTLYAFTKRVRALLRSSAGPTRYEGLRILRHGAPPAPRA